MPKNLVLMRYTDSNGRRLAALCRPQEGVELLREVIGEADEADERWFENAHASAVVIDTDGAVCITSADDLTMLSFWLATAANWLKTHGG